MTWLLKRNETIGGEKRTSVRFQNQELGSEGSRGYSDGRGRRRKEREERMYQMGRGSGESKMA